MSTLDLLNGTVHAGNWRPTNGLGPYGMALDPRSGDVYVADSGQATLSVLNASTGQLLSAIRVGVAPDAVAFDPVSNELYVANSGSSTVSVVDPVREQVVATLPASWDPTAVAVDPLTGRVFVADYGSGNVTVINATSNTMMGTIVLSPSSWPSDLAFDPGNGQLYVADSGTRNVSVVDANDDAVVTSIPVQPMYFAAGVAVDVVRGLVYVGEGFTNNVTVINASTDLVVTNVSVGGGPTGVATDALNGFVYVVETSASELAILNGSNDRQVGAVAVGGKGSALYRVLVDAAAGVVLVSDTASNQVFELNATTGALRGSVTIGLDPGAVFPGGPDAELFATDYAARQLEPFNGSSLVRDSPVPLGFYPDSGVFDPDNGRAYVANGVALLYNNESFGAPSNNLSVIDPATDVPMGAYPVGQWPTGVAFDSRNGDLYVANFLSDNVTVIDAASGKLVRSIHVGDGPSAVAVDGANGAVYVTNWYDGNVSVIDGGSQTVVGRLGTGAEPTAIAVDPVTGEICVANTLADTVTLINVTDGGVARSFEVGVEPAGIAVDPWTGYVYVTNARSDNVSVIDAPAGTEDGSIDVGSGPFGITFDPTTGRLYVADFLSGTISVLGPGAAQLFSVSLRETGLPAGTVWGVNFSELVSETTDGTYLAFALANGTYAFTAGTTDRQYRAAPGSFAVEGEALSETIVFELVTFEVEVTVRGLPPATGWYLNVSGEPPLFSSSGSGSLPLPNGSYSYSVGTPDKRYESAPGTFRVNGGAVPLPIVFALVTFEATVREVGLPPGTLWWVTLSNGSSYPSANSTVRFAAPNGSYLLMIGAAAGYTASPGSEVLRIAGSGVSVDVSFAESPQAPALPLGLAGPLGWVLLGVGVVAATVWLLGRHRRRGGPSGERDARREPGTGASPLPGPRIDPAERGR